MKWMFVIGLLGVLHPSLAANILFLIPMPARSHYNLGDRVIRELCNRGHHVTLISAFSMANPPKNLTEITVNNLDSLFKEMSHLKTSKEGRFGLRSMTPFSFIFLSSMGEFIFDGVMQSKPVQDFMKSNAKFDLVIGECFLVEGLLAGFSQKYKTPMVGMTTFMPNTWSNVMVGNPAPASYVPEPILSLTHKMTFLERCTNFLYGIFTLLAHHFKHLPAQDRLMKKYFGDDLPSLHDLIPKTSLVLVNHHYSLAFPRPYLPNMIEIGGFHIKMPQPLPKDLETFISEAEHGVILFSMGSNLQSSDLPEEKFRGILNAFSKLKQRVLWKFEKDNVPDIPKNVKISKWLPQNDILAHPNVKLFITHGGLLSTTEAIYRGVPLVAIPIFGDQPMNVKFIVDFEIGVKLEYDEIKEDTLMKAINEVLSNPKYAKNVKHRSIFLRDVPIPPLDNAIYWIEYVIRHKGAPHLQSASQDLSWYQLYLLDVIGFMGLVVLAALFLILKSVKCCRSFLAKKKQKPVSQKKKN